MAITDTLARSLRELPRLIGTVGRRSCENCNGAKIFKNLHDMLAEREQGRPWSSHFSRAEPQGKNKLMLALLDIIKSAGSSMQTIRGIHSRRNFLTT